MDSRRALAMFGTLALVVAMSVPSLAQERKKLSRDELTQYDALNTLVTAVSSGKQPAPADAKLTFHNHFLKTDIGVYVPYTVEIEPNKFTSFPVGVYVRAVSKDPAPATPAAKGSKSVTGAATTYAFEDVVFLTKPTETVSRAMELSPGEYDIHIALLEKAPRDKKIPTKSALLTQPLTVPSMTTGLTTSSVILAKSIDPETQQLTGQQQLEQPYSISGYKINPRLGSNIPKSEEFLFVFFIYNEGSAASGKPDVDVDYLFYRAAEEKPFTKLATTPFNAQTLPPEFSSAAGHQVFVGQGIPLTTFAPGDYKLEIKVSDKTNSATVTRNVPFTVTP
jgi:hypothetical protein